MVRSTEQIARGYFERIAARDPDGMMEFWQPGGIGRIHGLVELRAPDTYREWFANLLAAMPDMLFEVLEVVADDERAAVRWRMTATFDGAARFEGLEPNGARATIEGFDLLTIRDGKLVSNEAYMNGAEMMRQLGVLPAQGSRGERLTLSLVNLRTRIARALRRSRSPV